MSNEKVKLIYGPYGYVIGTADRVNDYLNCSCCNANSEDNEKRKITLLFDREALLYDIGNLGYVEGDIIPDEAIHNKHLTIDLTEDGNVDRVTRILDLAHSMIVEYLYPFTKEDCEEGLELDDVFKETPTYTIVMNVPKKFSTTTAKLLEQLIHEYFIDSVLADWLAITNPNAAAKWSESAQGLLSEIKRKVNSRTGVLLRPLRPF